MNQVIVDHRQTHHRNYRGGKSLLDNDSTDKKFAGEIFREISKRETFIHNIILPRNPPR